MSCVSSRTQAHFACRRHYMVGERAVSESRRHDQQKRSCDQAGGNRPASDTAAGLAFSARRALGSAREKARARIDACQFGVAGNQAIERSAGSGGRMGRFTPAVSCNQPVRVTRPVCGSMVKRAITEPSWVASAKPMAPSAVGATSTTFQL